MIRRLMRHAIDRSVSVAPREAEGYPHFRRNYLLGILNGLLFTGGLSFFSRTTIVPVFLAGLHAPSIIIAITSLFENLGWHLPQLVASKFVLHMPRKMRLYRIGSMVRLVGLVMAVGAAPLSSYSMPGALVLFVAGYGLFAVAGGFSGIVFADIVAKTTPKQKRGTYFGWRAITGGVVGFIIGIEAVKPIFASIGVPTSYMLSFVLGTVMIALSFMVFMNVREPSQLGLPSRRSMRTHLTTAGRILVANPRFRRFVFFRMLAMLWFAAVPFYMLFAKDRLGADDATMGTFISWEFAGLVTSNLFLGFFSNRFGNRIVLVLACTMAVAVSVLAFVFASGTGTLPPWMFGIVFFLTSGIDSGLGNGGLNYALEIVPEEERTTYVGLMNTLVACALGIAAVIGSLRDSIGYAGLFASAGTFGLVALVLVLRLPEPRSQLRVTSDE